MTALPFSNLLMLGVFGTIIYSKLMFITLIRKNKIIFIKSQNRARLFLENLPSFIILF